MKKTIQKTNNDNKKVVLEMIDIKKYFGNVKALDGVNLKMREGSVMALMGENGAGKSTILKTLFGIHKKTSGKILLNGNEVNFTSTKNALNHGVAMVHQELQQVLTTSVVDNLWLGRFPKIGPLVNKVKMIEDTKKIFKELEIDVNPEEKIANLSVSKRQMIEIAKAVSYNSKILVLDEPTSSLTENEVQHLFRILKNLKSKGVSILFVSHKMSEIFQIADYVTVFRDGKYISENLVSKTSMNQLIKDMVGRELENQFPKKAKIDIKAKELLRVKNLSTKYNNLVQNINFDLKEGEILGIAGLVGSGRTEMVEMLFGRRHMKDESKIFLRGEELDISSPKIAMKHGFAMVTEERKQDGIFSMLDIEFNTTIAQINAYKGKSGFLNKRLLNAETDNMIKKFATKTPSRKEHIGNLSGGNQQKVIVARWLVRQPNIFIMDEPTRGIDVGAKYKIYELMNELAETKKGIIMVSSEMPELIGVCHRIAVMSDGKLAGILKQKDFTQEKIMTLAAKYY